MGKFEKQIGVWSNSVYKILVREIINEAKKEFPETYKVGYERSGEKDIIFHAIEIKKWFNKWFGK